jgi:hypothetical protein
MQNYFKEVDDTSGEDTFSGIGNRKVQQPEFIAILTQAKVN